MWEYEVEGNVTRFAAIYRSHGVDHVGSIRSARLPDLELVPMYQALLAYSGANDNIKEMILKGTCLDDKGGRMRCPEGQEPFSRWQFQAITPQFGDNCPPFAASRVLESRLNTRSSPTSIRFGIWPPSAT